MTPKSFFSSAFSRLRYTFSRQIAKFSAAANVIQTRYGTSSKPAAFFTSQNDLKGDCYE